MLKLSKNYSTKEKFKNKGANFKGRFLDCKFITF